MKTYLKAGFILILTTLMLACSSNNPYNDSGSQRERAKQAQDELHRDTSK